MDDLLTIVKDKGELSDSNASDLLNEVLAYLSDTVPHIYAKNLERTLLEIDAGTLPADDARQPKIYKLLASIAEIQENMQQRLWSSSDDTTEVEDLLSQILELLANAESDDVHCDAIKEDDFEAVKRLAQFYKDEKRASVRVLLMQIFGLMGGLVADVNWELVRSGLPRYLTDNIMHEEDEQVLMFALFLSTVLLAHGNLPSADRDILRQDLVARLLDVIEEEREDETVTQAALNCLLAVNLQFSYGEGDQNPVLIALAQHKRPSFGENVLLVFNRGEPDSGTNPCLKLFRDMFAYVPTASFFYTNDMRVVVDVTLRELVDLPEPDKTRNEYLEMLHDLLKNSNYIEQRYRNDDIRSIVGELVENSEVPARARQLSKRVLEECADELS